MFRRVLRPRVLAYFAILGLIVLAAGASLALRVPLKVDVIRDRASLAREIEGGRIENVYRLQVMNTEERARRVRFAVEGPQLLSSLEVLVDEPALELAPTGTRTFAVRVRAQTQARRGSQPIEFIVSTEGEGKAFVVREKSRFLVP